MAIENESSQQSGSLQSRWHIDLEWYSRNSRSFSLTAGGSLCPKCQKKLKIGTSETPPARIIAAVHTCCAESRDYIPPRVPIMESIFRILLANGNQPLTAVELLEKLRERRGEGNIMSLESLERLLDCDRYYGLARAA